MKKHPIILCSFFLLAAGVDFAAAKTYKVDAAAGRSKVIGYHMLFEGRSCRGMNPGKARVRKAPKHGKIRFVSGMWTYTKGKCKGYRVPYIDFVYTGNGKPDYAEVSVSGSMYADDSGHRAWVYKYKINQ